MAEITAHFGDFEVSVPLQVLAVVPSGPAVLRIDTANLDPFIEALIQNGRFFSGTEMNATVAAGAAQPPLFGETWWFGRVHIVPTQFLLGTVLTGVERSWEFYNGKNTPVSIVSIVAAADGGFTITVGNVVTPFTVNPTASEVYTVAISADGPDAIAAVYTYTTADGDVRTVSFTGQRLILLSEEVDKPIREEWGFLTDILTQQDGVETQRRAMRDVPRQRLTYRFVLDELRAQLLDNQMFDWNRRLWGFPDRTQFVTLTAPAAAPDTSVAVTDTTDIDFRSGVNESCVLYIDSDNFETAELSGVAANTLSFASELTGAVNFPVGTKVYPVRLGYGSQTYSETQYKTGARVREITFAVKRNVDLGDLSAALPTNYKSIPVFDRLIFTANGLSIPVRYEFGGQPWDPDGIGVFTQKTFREAPRITHPIRFYMDDRAEYVAIRKLIHGANGRQKSFWVPSYRPDFEIETDQASGVLLTVEKSNYTKHVFPLNSNLRRDIQIEYTDGTTDLREIDNASEGVQNETLTLDTASSQALSKANVRRISYLNRSRFGSDSFVFLHTRRDYVVMDTTIVQIEQ